MKNSKCLVNLTRGQGGTVTELTTNDENTLKKLMSMGILPGTSIKVIQTFPSFVYQAGYTQVAVDRQIASVIQVST